MRWPRRRKPAPEPPAGRPERASPTRPAPPVAERETTPEPEVARETVIDLAVVEVEVARAAEPEVDGVPPEPASPRRWHPARPEVRRPTPRAAPRPSPAGARPPGRWHKV